MSKEQIVTYYEYYPHYMGTLSCDTTMTMAEFEQFIGFAEKECDDEIDQIQQCLEARAGKPIYAMGSLFDSMSPRKLLKTLKKKGVVGSLWEEGSFAFSIKGLKAAKQEVVKMECEIAFDNC